MAEQLLDLQTWMNKVTRAQSRAEILAILDEFRVIEWSDEQRSQMAKLYMRLLLALPDDGSAAPKDSQTDVPKDSSKDA